MRRFHEIITNKKTHILKLHIYFLETRSRTIIFIHERVLLVDADIVRLIDVNKKESSRLG